LLIENRPHAQPIDKPRAVFAVVQNVDGETRLHHKSVPHSMHWSNVFAARAAELGEARPELAAAVEPLLKAREAVERQIADLDRKVAASHRRISRYCSSAGRAQSRHFSL
jgi:hypothetical protein